jgi:hypothetical protein
MCRPAILTQPTANQPPAGLKPAGGLIREHQYAGYAYDRKQSFRTPHKTKNPSLAWKKTTMYIPRKLLNVP